MKILLIEASTEKGAAFIFDGEKLLSETYLPPGVHNSSHLMPAIATALQTHQLTPRDLTAIGVGVGPGSYTGIRIGAMIAKTLSYANKVPLIGFCSLYTFATPKHKKSAVIIDAKIGGAYLYTAGYSPKLYALNELDSILQNVEVLITPSMSSLKPKLAQLFPTRTWQWEEHYPSPTTMLALAIQALHAQHYSLDGSLELLYMRKTQAEIDKERKT